MTGLVARSILRRALRFYARHASPLPGRNRVLDLARGIDSAGVDVLSEIAPGMWMSLDLGSHVERQLYYDGFYRRKLLDHFMALLHPGDTVVDVGANVGSHTIYAAKAVGPSGRVIAFEPEERCFERLVANLELNRFAQVEAHRVAIADREGEVELHINDPQHPNQGQSSLARLDVHVRGARVRCGSLDGILAQAGLGRIDVLKIDTQGAEALALRGAARTIQRDHPTVYLRTCEHLCRALGTSTVEVQEILMAHGYELTRIDPGPSTVLSIVAPLPDATIVARVRGGGDGRSRS